MNKKVLILLGLTVLIALSVVILYNSVETEEDRLEAFLLDIIANTPQQNGEYYLQFVQLNNYGFRMQIMQKKSSFGKQSEQKFLSTANNYAEMVFSSKLTVKHIEVEVKNETQGTAVLTVIFEQGKNSKLPLSKAVANIRIKMIKHLDSWYFISLELKPERSIKALL